MVTTTRVAVIGLGAIGREVLKALDGRPSIQVVAAADPQFAGRDAGEVAGLSPSGVLVVSRAEEALVAGAADVALVLTMSGTAEMVPIVEAAAAAHVHIVSSCEDLAYADWGTPELARKIDALALAGGIAVLGYRRQPRLRDGSSAAAAGRCLRAGERDPRRARGRCGPAARSAARQGRRRSDARGVRRRRRRATSRPSRAARVVRRCWGGGSPSPWTRSRATSPP